MRRWCMRNEFRPVALFILAFALALPARAQQTPAELSIHVTGADVSDFPRVKLTVTVRDANGVPVPGLEKDGRAFEVNEDRRPEARPIESVEPAVNYELPVGLVLVVDISGSMAGQPLADAQAAARTLVESAGEEDEVAFIAFESSVDLDGLEPAREHPPTTDRRVVEALIDSLEAGGGTPLYDALYKGVRWAQEATLGHRAVILLTDGVDEDPGSAVASQETPIQEATRANVPVFTIGLGNNIDQGYLERVARTTGGTYQETPDSADLTELFLNVLRRLKQQYIITYESGLPGDGEVHRAMVRVEMEGRQADDESEIGPLPLVEPPPTDEPTEEPVEEPVEEPTEEIEVVSMDEPAAEEPTPVADRPVGEASPSSSPSTTLPVGAILGGLGLLAFVVIIVIVGIRRRRAAQQEYCKGCGRELAPGEVCPECGPDAGRFRRSSGR
jgi:VWFA-related protein